MLGWVAVAIGLGVATTVWAGWWRVLEEDFASDPAGRWTYVGVTNGSGQPLFRYEAGDQRVHGEWDQGRVYAGGQDPEVILPSRLSRPLDRMLTDADTFRVGATVRIAAGTVPDTTEFFQIANFGLYNLEAEVWGADRGQSDNYSGNAQLVRDANSLVEFNYFINNRSFGFNPFIQATLIAEMPAAEFDNTAYFVTGGSGDALFHNTDMGADTYLPFDVNLYVEFVYHGAATGQIARRVYCGIYTEPERTNLLTVGGVPMYYWTRPADSQQVFRVTHAALLNWPSVNYTVLFGGSTPDGAGQGSYDDVYVDLEVAPTHVVSVGAQLAKPRLQFVTEPGRSYAVLEAVDLTAGTWSTVAVVNAEAEFTAWTNEGASAIGLYRIEEQP